jgi:hypothetical protein
LNGTSTLELWTNPKIAKHRVAEMETAHALTIENGGLNMPTQSVLLIGLGQLDHTREEGYLLHGIDGEYPSRWDPRFPASSPQPHQEISRWGS